jgi:hypothetical protein
LPPELADAPADLPPVPPEFPAGPLVLATVPPWLLSVARVSALFPPSPPEPAGLHAPMNSSVKSVQRDSLERRTVCLPS